ncbi:hypothetical protein RsTz2092_05650 [Deferribacterales bacterium RsTz2092]|nr:hypothetical protein AGMMS49941_10300 [Deferribacterales bacterium]
MGIAQNIRRKIYRLFPTYRLVERKVLPLEKRLVKIENLLLKMSAGQDFLYDVSIDGMSFQFYDLLSSSSVDFVTDDMNSGKANAELLNMNFKDGDCIIDIGGNVGIVSIYLAKKHPNIKIYAYEPVKRNYENFLKNIKVNNIPDGVIEVFNKAVTQDGRDVHAAISIRNTGASSIYYTMGATGGGDVPSITLDKIFEENNISKCALLKIDCEGAEYEIIYNTKGEHLRKCACILGETHGKLADGKALIEYCREFIPLAYWDLQG